MQDAMEFTYGMSHEQFLEDERTFNIEKFAGYKLVPALDKCNL